jgi:hypothetical protein
MNFLPSKPTTVTTPVSDTYEGLKIDLQVKEKGLQENMNKRNLFHPSYLDISTLSINRYVTLLFYVLVALWKLE